MPENPGPVKTIRELIERLEHLERAHGAMEVWVTEPSALGTDREIEQVEINETDGVKYVEILIAGEPARTPLAESLAIALREAEKRTLIGRVGVDSGMLLITDPSYADPAGQDSAARGIELALQRLSEALSEATDGMPLADSIPFKAGHEGAGVFLSSGIGDGFYPVYGVYSDTGEMGVRIIRAEVDFMDHPWVIHPYTQIEKALAALEAGGHGPEGYWDEGGDGRAALDSARFGGRFATRMSERRKPGAGLKPAPRLRPGGSWPLTMPAALGKESRMTERTSSYQHELLAAALRRVLPFTGEKHPHVWLEAGEGTATLVATNGVALAAAVFPADLEGQWLLNRDALERIAGADLVDDIALQPGPKHFTFGEIEVPIEDTVWVDWRRFMEFVPSASFTVDAAAMQGMLNGENSVAFEIGAGGVVWMHNAQGLTITGTSVVPASDVTGEGKFHIATPRIRAAIGDAGSVVIEQFETRTRFSTAGYRQVVANLSGFPAAPPALPPEKPVLKQLGYVDEVVRSLFKGELHASVTVRTGHIEIDWNPEPAQTTVTMAG